MVQKVAVRCEFWAGLPHGTTGKLSLSVRQYMGTFFELRKYKAAEGQGWGPHFICCAHDTVGF